MSLLVGLRVSSRSPPMLRTTRPTPRFDRSASTAGACLRASCAVLAAVGAARAAARCLHRSQCFGEVSSCWFVRHDRPPTLAAHGGRSSWSPVICSGYAKDNCIHDAQNPKEIC
jgi:hypothetical protein